ncbi:hypothetical protein L6452_39076 [Arctium lappa]|uniref:Uncharacterized protein n=1 Tax=Arctium lappa TaxID=4217 RepID=A0ACB8XRY5_ARCLA|nr:hypothetical protein L6452_39076 [Arctium lappa]
MNTPETRNMKMESTDEDLDLQHLGFLVFAVIMPPSPVRYMGGVVNSNFSIGLFTNLADDGTTLADETVDLCGGT